MLVLDTGSPTSSLALGTAGKIFGRRDFPLRRTSEELLPQLRGLLKEIGLSFAELGGVVALQGPGSFTGLRIGLATALGFHQALGLPATAIGTLPVLAGWALRAWVLDARPQEVMVAVDALRGDFFGQLFWRGDEARPGAVVPVAEADALHRRRAGRLPGPAGRLRPRRAASKKPAPRCRRSASPPSRRPSPPRRCRSCPGSTGIPPT